MRALGTLADFLSEIGAPIGGGAGAGGVFGFLVGVIARAWVVDRVVPIGPWVMWGTGIGGVVGLVAALSRSGPG